MARKRSLDDGPVLRAEILATASRLFYERGYDASIRDLADTVGISSSTMYHHFANKQDILYAIIVPFMQDFDAAIVPMLRDGTRSPEDRLAQAARLHVKNRRRPPPRAADRQPVPQRADARSAPPDGRFAADVPRRRTRRDRRRLHLRRLRHRGRGTHHDGHPRHAQRRTRMVPQRRPPHPRRTRRPLPTHDRPTLAS
nr:TetR/AcrR family transcriptional regulator [Fodinicola feengrottensis]